jgi:hypothetical protein
MTATTSGLSGVTAKAVDDRHNAQTAAIELATKLARRRIGMVDGMLDL